MVRRLSNKTGTTAVAKSEFQANFKESSEKQLRAMLGDRRMNGDLESHEDEFDVIFGLS